MNILDTHAAASSLAVEGSHPGAMLGHPSHEPFDVSQFVDEEHLVTGTLGHDPYPSWLDVPLCFFPYDDTTDSFLSWTSYPVTPSESSHSEGVDPRLISGNSTGPSSPDDRHSEDYSDPSSAFPSPCENVGDIDPAEEDEEEPFLSPRPFLTLERCEATSAPSVDGNENKDEGQDETEAESTESPQQGLEKDVEEDTEEDSEEGVPRTGPGPATDAPDAQACPGLKGKDKDEIQEDLRQCMAQANTYAADAREKCSEKMTKDGKKFKCTECGETKRRKDRLQTHIYSKHLGGKSWICPRCERGYTARNELYNHLLSKRVVCLCGMSLTKNNSYTHARICKMCTAVGGRPTVEDGHIVMVEVTAPQAGSSHTAHDSVGEDEPLAPPQGGTVGRTAAKKRKERDFDQENEDEPRRRKRVKSRRT